MKRFYNKEYDCLLGSFNNYRRAGGKKIKNNHQWNAILNQIAEQFRYHNLKPNGISDAHTIIIASILVDLSLDIVARFGSAKLNNDLNNDLIKSMETL